MCSTGSQYDTTHTLPEIKHACVYIGVDLGSVLASAHICHIVSYCVILCHIVSYCER